MQALGTYHLPPAFPPSPCSDMRSINSRKCYERLLKSKSTIAGRIESIDSKQTRVVPILFIKFVAPPHWKESTIRSRIEMSCTIESRWKYTLISQRKIPRHTAGFLAESPSLDDDETFHASTSDLIEMWARFSGDSSHKNTYKANIHETIIERANEKFRAAPIKMFS